MAVCLSACHIIASFSPEGFAVRSCIELDIYTNTMMLPASATCQHL